MTAKDRSKFSITQKSKILPPLSQQILIFNRLNAVMLRFRMIATRSACRMRSISELKVREYEQGKEVDFKIIQLTAAYLTSVVENPDSLAVDASYWQQLAEIIATADCLQHVHRVRLVKISDQVTGLIADVQLNYAIVAQDRFLPESELYYVAHNTNFSSCVSICKQGAFRPSKWNQDDVTWRFLRLLFMQGAI